MRVRKRRGSSARYGRNVKEKLERGLERRTAEIWSAQGGTEGNRRRQRRDIGRDRVEGELRRRGSLKARAGAQPLANRTRRVGKTLLSGRGRSDVLRFREQRHVAGEQAVQVDEVHEQGEQQVRHEGRHQCPTPPCNTGERNQDTRILHYNPKAQ